MSDAATISILASWTSEDPRCLRDSTMNIKETMVKNDTVKLAGVKISLAKMTNRSPKEARLKILKGESEADLKVLAKTIKARKTRNR